MPTLLEHLLARVAAWHARRVAVRFEAALTDVAAAQQQALQRTLAVVGGSDFARTHGLAGVRTPRDLARAVPLGTYADRAPYLRRVWCGETTALLHPRQSPVMFASSSGTTDEPKRIPVTPAFVADYRRGWNVFGLRMLSDHPAAFLRTILQSSGRHDSERSPTGVPCGAITGLLARTQKRIVRRFYVGSPEIARIDDAKARYYTLMRCGVTRDVAFAITANPATLVRLARVADEHSETLIRDVHDGTLDATLVPDAALRNAIAARLHPDPARAAELERLRRTHGRLRPRDYWRLVFVACWTGGSLGHYLPAVADWWGPVPVRDVGLLASEGRVTIPLDDGEPVGVLDVTSGVWEFIPVESAEAATTEAVGPQEVEQGREYVVVLSNTTGLIRYRLDDVVRVRGWVGQAPLLEFLYRWGRVASVAGEKLTEHQAVRAVQVAAERLGAAPIEFVLAPWWGDPPFYILTCPGPSAAGLAEAVDSALGEQNEEYASRRKSLRLGSLRVNALADSQWTAIMATLERRRRGPAEQFKRPQLLTKPDEAAELYVAAGLRVAGLSLAPASVEQGI